MAIVDFLTKNKNISGTAGPAKRAFGGFLECACVAASFDRGIGTERRVDADFRG
jgi:hypothetical protein